MALNCVKAAVVRGASKRQNIHIPYPLSLTLTAELGVDQSPSGSGTAFRHPWPVGGCPRTSSWERRRFRGPITPYCEAFQGDTCRMGPIGGCPRTSSWERRRPRRPNTTYREAFSSSCLSIRAQVGELPFDWFLRNPAGGGAHACGGLTMRHLVLSPAPSPPPSASVQSRADRELQAGMPVDQCLSVLG